MALTATYIFGPRLVSSLWEFAEESMRCRRAWWGVGGPQFYSLSVLIFAGFIAAPAESTLKDESHASQDAVAGPYNGISTPNVDGRF